MSEVFVYTERRGRSKQVQKNLNSVSKPVLFVLGVALSGLASQAQALELDWSGQFRGEYHLVTPYTLDGSQGSPDAARAAAGGYYIGGSGKTDADFETLFLRLRPKVIVNDNVSIKSEFWVGDPIFGFFGAGSSFFNDQRQLYSSQSRGSVITAQRVWGEFQTDLGTVQIGRLPLQWGLGIVWNDGEDVWSRYMSTGDAIRFSTKFGAFSFIPSFIKYSMGNTVGGSCTVAGGTCTAGQGSGDVTDYSLILKYDNPDEEFEGGLNFIRRIASSGQDANYGFFGVGTGGGAQGGSSLNYNTFDIYLKRRFGKFTVGVEVPLVGGTIGGISYKSYGVAVEAGWKPSDSWESHLKIGQAPGQPNSSTAIPDTFKAFFYNPNYKLGLIMFNYQLANFGRANSQNNATLEPKNAYSIYDNPVVNAQYIAFTQAYKTEKWNFHGSFIMATAAETAQASGNFFNTWDRAFHAYGAGAAQSNFLGWEVDAGVGMKWDEATHFGLDMGLYFPGNFMKFSNTATENQTKSVFAMVVKAGVNF